MSPAVALVAGPSGGVRVQTLIIAWATRRRGGGGHPSQREGVCGRWGETAQPSGGEGWRAGEPRVASVDAPKVLIDEWDNAAAAAQVTSPFLVVHGEADTYIQPESAEEIYAAIKADLKRLWLVPGADHAEAAETEPELYRSNLSCWIAQTCTVE